MLSSALQLLPTVLTYSLVMLILAWCWFHWTHRDLIRFARKLPVIVPTLPIVGHIMLFIGSREKLAKTIIQIPLEGVAKGIKWYSLWCGPIPIVTLLDKDDIQTVLSSSSSSDKADEYKFFDCGKGPLKCSLLTSPGHIWKITRKHFNPMFHPNNVQLMMPEFNQNSRVLVSCLSEHVGRGSVNVMHHTMDISLKTVCNLLFGPGVEVDIKSPDFKGLMTVVETVPEFFIQRVLFPWMRIESVFRFWHRNKLKEIDIFWNNFTHKRLEKTKENNRRKEQQENNFKSVVEDETNTPNNTSEEPLNILEVIGILQKNYPQFSDACLRDEMLTFYCTGTDTVGSGAASCFLVLAYYQDIQERLFKEISSTVGRDDDVTLEDLNRMPYLDQVIKETLRWFLIVPFVMRKVGKDISLSTCTIPAGTTLSLCIAAIHMNPKLYPEPYNFNPDRFSPENFSSKERFAFIPFSGGPRNCIAKTYAMQLMKVMVVHVLRKFRMKTEMDIFNLRKRLVVTLVNADGYNISFEHRKYN